jgi:phytoene dehydrogenase-like protein
MIDAVVIGSGPNGLAAAVALAQAGAAVLVLEAHPRIGGGTRTAELTLPGFHHDVCSTAHPMGELSPYLRTLPLDAHGLRWLRGTA